MRPLLLRDAAREDLREAYSWYQARRAGLGSEFIVAVRHTLQAIESNPEQYPIVVDDIRKAPLRRFPYVVKILYRATAGFLLPATAILVTASSAFLAGYREQHGGLHRIYVEGDVELMLSFALIGTPAYAGVSWLLTRLQSGPGHSVLSNHLRSSIPLYIILAFGGYYLVSAAEQGGGLGYGLAVALVMASLHAAFVNLVVVWLGARRRDPETISSGRVTLG